MPPAPDAPAPPPPLQAAGTGGLIVPPPKMTCQPPPLPAVKSPIWTALLIGPLAIVMAILVGGIFSVAAIALTGGMETLMKGGDVMALMNMLAKELFVTPIGALLLILPGQLIFLGAALTATMLSRVPWKMRLGFERSRFPLWTWPILGIGTFFIGSVSGIAVEAAFPNHLQQLEFFGEIAKAGGPGIALFNGLMLSLLPGFAEETMFRGYIQTRLLSRWSAITAISVSSVIFAVAHFDPVHVIAVLPIGLWLGVIAWRAGSIIPAMFCHALMNGASLLGARFSDGGKTTWDSETFALLGVCGFVFVLSLGILKGYGSRKSGSAVAEV